MTSIRKNKGKNGQQLRKFYEEAFAMSKNGEVTAEMLHKKFGISLYGAACILYMIQSEEYCPELENIYTHDECNPIKGKDEKKDRMIKFFEDLPPFKHYQTYYHSDISDEDMERYVSLGLAKWVSFEDYRLDVIQMYVSIRRFCEQHNADMREALAHKDREFFTEYFKTKDEKVIIKSLKRDKFNAAEIKSVLKLLSPK